MKSGNSKLKLLLLAVVLLLAVLTRSYKINSSLTDWFSWRQTDTAAVGRFLERNQFNLLKPQYYDLSNIQSGLDNPEGLRMVEFPLYSAIFAVLHQQFPILPIAVWARIVSIVFFLMMLVAVFRLLEEEFGLAEAFFGSLFLAINPFAVFYSRTVLPDMPATSLAFLATYFLYRYLKSSWFFLLLSAILMAAALLIKPTVIFFLLPALYLFWKKQGSLVNKILPALFFLLVALVPLIVWRTYIQQFPEGIPVSQWLLTSVNTPEGLQPIFFRPSFFRWIFFERISQLILGGFLVFFLLLGVLFQQKKNSHLSLIFMWSSLLYLFVFQGGNVQHEYYQILILPTLGLLIGAGSGYYFRQKKNGFVIVRLLVILGLFMLSSLFSYYQVKNKYDEQSHLVLIADVVKSLTTQKDLIVTDSQGDTTLLYLSDRRGYPAPYKELSVLKDQGAKYFVTQDLNYKNTLLAPAELIFENDQVLIFKL